MNIIIYLLILPGMFVFDMLPEAFGKTGLFSTLNKHNDTDENVIISCIYAPFGFMVYLTVLILITYAFKRIY